MKDNHNLRRGEAGQALVLVTIILLLAALILPPLLGLNFSGTRSAQISEDKALRLYAADAGIEDALYQIKNGIVGSSPKSYTMASDINRSTVDVTISDLGGGTYSITSTATGISGGETTVESYVSFSADYSYLTDYAVATDGELENEGAIIGDVRCGTLEEKAGSSITGNVTIGDPLPYWPTADELKVFYWADVEGSESTDNPFVITGNPTPIGPWYHDGSLVITSDTDKLGQLMGTIYVKGNLNINLSSGTTLDLNGHTIFVEGEVNTSNYTSFLGPGAIIAVQKLQLHPVMENTGFVFLMSVENQVEIKKSNDGDDFYFYGTLASAIEAEVDTNGTLINNADPPVLNIPGMGGGGGSGTTSILTYTIKNGG